MRFEDPEVTSGSSTPPGGQPISRHTQRLRLVGFTLLTLLVLGGTASCLKMLSADTWWSRDSFGQPAIRDQLESQPGRVLRVVRSSSSSGEAVALSQKLRPETLLYFADAPLPPEHPAVLSSHQLGQVLIRIDQAAEQTPEGVPEPSR